MKQISVAEILELPVAERIRLVGLIWDSIAAVPEAIPISDELKAELDRRLAEFEADPDAGSPWEEVRKRIVQGTWRTG
jgi:putative addiction module component (TIGR02574 family)